MENIPGSSVTCMNTVPATRNGDPSGEMATSSNVTSKELLMARLLIRQDAMPPQLKWITSWVPAPPANWCKARNPISWSPLAKVNIDEVELAAVYSNASNP